MWRAVFNLLRDAYRYASFGNPRFLGGFRGIYENFEQAEAAAPRGSRLGYNHQDLASEYLSDLDLHPQSSDYPLLFHLQRIQTERATVLDFGGNIGVHYLRYRKYLNLESVKWIVLDFPEITKAGRQACAGFSNVTFVNDVAELEEPRLDILLASGSMQYIQSPALLLCNLNDKGLRPRHILINSVPLYEGKRFVTLQNGGLVYYPQYVFNRNEYIAVIEALGYELVDIWDDNTCACTIPFHREKSVPAFRGVRFLRK